MDIKLSANSNFRVLDSSGNAVAAINSDGTGTISGNIAGAGGTKLYKHAISVTATAPGGSSSSLYSNLLVLVTASSTPFSNFNELASGYFNVISGVVNSAQYAGSAILGLTLATPNGKINYIRSDTGEFAQFSTSGSDFTDTVTPL